MTSSQPTRKALIEQAESLRQHIRLLEEQQAVHLKEIQQLSFSRDQLLNVLETSSDVIYKLDYESWRLEYMSPSVLVLTGFTSREFLDNDFDWVMKRCHPDDKDKFLDYVRKYSVQANAGPLNPIYDFRWKCKDGRYRWFSTSFSPIRDASDKAVGLVGTVRDITHRKRIENKTKVKHEQLEDIVNQRTVELQKINEELKNEISKRRRIEDTLAEERNMLRTLIDTIPDHIYIKDLNGKFVLCNQSMALDIGLKSPDEIRNKSDFDFLRKELAEQYIIEEREILRTGKTLVNEEQIGRQVQGMDNWFYSSKAPLRDRHGAIIGIVGTNRNITERKLAEQKLTTYWERINQAEQIAELAALSATMAHELNQPLTVIRLLIQDSMAELEKTHCSSSIMENLKESLHEVTSANTIIKRYRSILRIPEQGLSQSIDLNGVAHRIAEALHKYAQHNQVNIGIEGLDGLPLLSGNPADYEQLFFIMIQNAIQAAEHKKWHTLDITGRRVDNAIELVFADDCSGIAPEHMDKIFDVFFTTKPRDVGTGFGLYIVRRILDHYEGKIQVRSRPHDGTTFTITLPVHPETML